MDDLLTEASTLNHVEELEVKCFFESFLGELKVPKTLNNIKKLSIQCYSEEKVKLLKEIETTELSYELQTNREILFDLDEEDAYRTRHFYDQDYLHDFNEFHYQ